MNIEQSKKQHPNIPIVEYKEKGEEMKQEEMKQEEMKQEKMKQEKMKRYFLNESRDVSIAIENFVVDDSTTENTLSKAKSSAKKLIEKIDEYLESLKPKFKVGDIVSSEIFIDGSGIVRLEEDLINDFSGIKGLWYIKKDCEIKDTAFGVVNKKTRHATPEEIAEYEVALTFHKHGRKPFEVKDGDLLENKFGRYIANGYSFSKEDFIVGSNAFLKAAEEVNEWLGADDDK